MPRTPRVYIRGVGLLCVAVYGAKPRSSDPATTTTTSLPGWTNRPTPGGPGGASASLRE